MRAVVWAVLLFVVACSSKSPVPTPAPVPIPKEESTFSWDRNTESNMADYVVYACWTKDCTNLTAIGTVRHPVVDRGPEFQVYIVGKVGAFAVTARNTAGRESKFSNLVNFDRR